MEKDAEYPTALGESCDRTIPSAVENFRSLMLTTPNLTPVRLNLARIMDITDIISRQIDLHDRRYLPPNWFIVLVSAH